MFNGLNGLLEAKVLLKHLYSSSVQCLLDLKQQQIQYENTSNGIFIFCFSYSFFFNFLTNKLFQNVI
jgi:hypothetical protein